MLGTVFLFSGINREALASLVSWVRIACGCESQAVLSRAAGPCSAQTVPTGLSSKCPQPCCPAGVPQHGLLLCGGSSRGAIIVVWPVGSMGQMHFNAAQQSRAVSLQKQPLCCVHCLTNSVCKMPVIVAYSYFNASAQEGKITVLHCLAVHKALALCVP